MKKLGTRAYEEIRTWIYRNARPLDLALWQFHFENGSRENAIEMLAVYQNGDGGFGNGLEPDSWNPESSPYATMVAIGILQGIGLTDRSHPVIRGILRFLEETDHRDEEGWFFGIPSNDNWPRAPWWTYDEKLNAVQNMGITAALCAFVLRMGDRQSEVFHRACGYVDGILGKLGSAEDFGEMGANGLGILLLGIEAGGLTERFDCTALKAVLKDIVDKSIERDPDKWEMYTHRPSEFIWSTDCPFYPGNEEIVERELDYTIDSRNPQGVWNITWTWFDLGERYAKEFAVSENWWMANKAMERLNFLKSFDRI